MIGGSRSRLPFHLGGAQGLQGGVPTRRIFRGVGFRLGQSRGMGQAMAQGDRLLAASRKLGNVFGDQIAVIQTPFVFSDANDRAGDQFGK